MSRVFSDISPSNQCAQNTEAEISLHVQTEAEIIRSLKDGKKAWIVCGASFLIQVWVVGILHAFGVFFLAFLEDFECTKAEAAWVGSACYGLVMTLAPIASTLINRFGKRRVAAIGSFICAISMISSSFVTNVHQLYGTFTFVFAFGCTLAYTPCMTIATDYFDKYITLATGIMTAGTSTGTLILSPIAQAIVSSYGWRNAFRFFGCTCCIGIVCAMMFKPLQLRPRNSVQRIKTSMAREHMKDLQLWKNKVYIIWICSIFSVMFGYYIPYVHLMSYAEELGIAKSLGSVLLMTLGGATASGRVLFGHMLQKGFLDRLRMDQLSMVITGTAVMLLPLCRTFASVLIYVIIVGLVDGCYVVLLPTLTEAFTSEDNKVVAWGFLNFFCSISFTLGPPVAGWLYDATGSYDISFHIAGIPIICGAVLLFFIPWAQKTSQSTNLMTAAQSYNVMSDPDTPTCGSEDSGGIEFKTNPITIPQSSPPDGGTEMLTIRSPYHNDELIEANKSRGSFVFIDLAKERVMAFSQTLNQSDAQLSQREEHLPEVLTKAIDVLRKESGSVVSLERTQNALNHGYSVERFAVASPISLQIHSRLASNAMSPLSSEGLPLFPTVSQLGARQRHTSLNSPTSSLTTPALTSGTNSNPQLAHTSNQEQSLVDLSVPEESQAAGPVILPIGAESPPPVFFQQISSNPSLPPIAEQMTNSQFSREFRGHVEGGDNARTQSRPNSPEGGQDAMFQMSDLSLTNFVMEEDD